MTPPSAGDKADIYQSGHWTQVARMGWGEVSRIYLRTVGIQKYSQMYVHNSHLQSLLQRNQIQFGI